MLSRRLVFTLLAICCSSLCVIAIVNAMARRSYVAEIRNLLAETLCVKVEQLDCVGVLPGGLYPTDKVVFKCVGTDVAQIPNCFEIRGDKELPSYFKNERRGIVSPLTKLGIVEDAERIEKFFRVVPDSDANALSSIRLTELSNVIYIVYHYAL